MTLFRREKASVLWSYAFPVFMILLFGAIFGREGSTPISVRVAVADRDHSFFSQLLVGSALARVPTFKVRAGDLDTLLTELKNGRGTLVLEIPQGFGRDLLAGRGAVNAYYNVSNLQFNAAALTVLEVIESRFAERMSGRNAPLKFTQVPVGATKEKWRYIDYLLPGLIGMSVMSTCLFSVGFVLTSYRERGNLKRLQVTPLPKWVFVLAIIIQRYVIILSQAALLVVIAILVFHAHLHGSLLDGFLFLTLGMVTFVALGFLIGARVAKAETGAGIANVIFFPMMFLSGTFFPVDNLPGILQPVLKVLPLKYLVEGLRQIFVEGASITSLGIESAVLAAFAVIFFVVSVKIFRWQ